MDAAADRPGEPLQKESSGVIPPSTTTTTLTGDRTWLGARHGTDSIDTITVDLGKLTKNTHYVEPTAAGPHGYVRSGVPVGRITASGLYGAYDPAATDGRQTLAGVVFSEAAFVPGQSKVPAALLWHGVVIPSRVPGGIDLTKVVASPAGAQLRFVEVG
ncbi:head decoration protein (plasmid) [Streptomyces sp. BI20]|uniref:head decoration protein n=1 Tax=Streptomyces sp. BI20 TaxID=3403460 RepID=UPI003C75639E